MGEHLKRHATARVGPDVAQIQAYNLAFAADRRRCVRFSEQCSGDVEKAFGDKVATLRSAVSPTCVTRGFPSFREPPALVPIASSTPPTRGMFAVSARAMRVPVAKTGSVPSTRKTARKTAIISAADPSIDGIEPARTRTADRDEPARPPRAGVPRRAAMAAALGLAAQTSGLARPSPASAAANALFALAEESAEGKTFEFKTYRLTAPSVYEEVNVPLKDPATGVVSPTVLLLKDTRAGQAGNTVSVSKQTVPQGGIASVADVGTARETAERLVTAEGARSTGTFGKAFGGTGSGVSFRDASERTDENGLLYYTAEYSKRVLGVERVVLTTLVVAEGQLYTLTAEEDAGRFESEMADGLRKCARSFQVIPQNTAPAAAPARAKKGRK